MKKSCLRQLFFIVYPIASKSSLYSFCLCYEYGMTSHIHYDFSVMDNVFILLVVNPSS